MCKEPLRHVIHFSLHKQTMKISNYIESLHYLNCLYWLGLCQYEGISSFLKSYILKTNILGHTIFKV